MQLIIKNLTNGLLLFVLLVAWWFTASVINPELHYYLRQTAFLTNSLFFEGFASYPGGIADYMSEFISQFFYFNTFGSFLIILVAALQGIMAIKIIERIAGKVKLNFTVFTLIVLLSVLILCNYHYPFYASIRLLITFGFVWGFMALVSKYPPFRFYASFIMALVLFYLAGGAALLVFALSVILVQIRFFSKKAELIILPIFALFSALLPYLAYQFIFLVNLPLVYSITHSKSPIILYYVPDYQLLTLYALLPVAIGLAIIFNWYKTRPAKAVDQPLPPKPEKAQPKAMGKKVHHTEIKPVTKPSKLRGQTLNSPLVGLVGQLIVMTALAIVSVYFTLDKKDRDNTRVSFYAANGDWDQVIKSAESLKEYDIFVNYEYNRALANKDQLTDHFFDYTQLAGPSALFMDEAVTSDVPFLCSDQYYDLGFMHESQHWAYEAQTIFPNSPRLMKRLVQIYLVAGKYKLAEKFLRRLDDNMLYHDWVAQHQKYIDDTTLVTKDPVFSFKRTCEPVDEFTASDHQLKLEKLLEANPQNKMAFDYLLCSTLLDGNLARFKSMMDENSLFRKNPLPRSWDEALVLYHYMSRTPQAPADLQYTKPRLDQFMSFIKAIKPYGQDWQAARQALKRDYGTTYWYYLKCLSPKVTNAQTKRQKPNG